MTLALFEWPAPIEPKSRKVGNEYQRYYPIPEIGDCAGVTTFLKVVGTGTNALINWAANLEREAAIEAALDVLSRHRVTGASAEAREAIEARLGPARKHQKAVQAAADIGSEVHNRIKWDLCGLTKQHRMLGEPKLSQQSGIAYLAYRNWWEQAGLTPLRSEQTVWHREHRYAGTVDLFALDENEDLGVLDFKSSKYVYDTHHMQLMAYIQAARTMGLPVKWGKLIHLPKTVEQLTGDIVQPVELGQLWDRKLSEAELWSITQAALRLWRGLCEKRD